MNIFAVIKKAVNSDLNKPLNVKLDEIKMSIDKKPTYKVETGIGVQYNTNISAQVLTMDDAPVFSVNGRGRILQVLPMTPNSATKDVMGTALFTVDGQILLNNRIYYATTHYEHVGDYMVDSVRTPPYSYFYSYVFGGTKKIYVDNMLNCRIGDATDFMDSTVGIVAPTGIAFNEGFEIRLTQNHSNVPNDFGVMVAYELYE